MFFIWVDNNLFFGHLYSWYNIQKQQSKIKINSFKKQFFEIYDKVNQHHSNTDERIRELNIVKNNKKCMIGIL